MQHDYHSIQKQQQEQLNESSQQPQQQQQQQQLKFQQLSQQHPPPQTTKQKKFAQQRSILKNSQDYNNEEYEILEAKKQMILRRRRLFSHYRQYEQWRRRQFSYDPCYSHFRYRTSPIHNDFHSSASGSGSAFRRRRQYQRQYSCRETSRESREGSASSSLQRYPTAAYSDTIQTDSSNNNQANPSQQNSFDSSECAALAYQPLHCNSRHYHMMAEEPSTLIAERCTRSRINSAIFVSSEGRGFDSIEFLRRHGSQSVLCRKAKSAENITDNGRKKSFSDNRQWRTDEDSSMDKRATDSNEDNVGIEMKETRPTSELRTVPVLKSVIDATTLATTSICGIGTVHGTAVTTANVVIGSISIEAPPAHLMDDLSINSGTVNIRQHTMSSSKTNSTSHDSADTVEEQVVVVPTANATNSADPADVPAVAYVKPHTLMRQRSSNTYSTTTTHSSQSPALTTSHSSPKALNLKVIKPQQLPMVSIEGPSPTQEKPPPAECL